MKFSMPVVLMRRWFAAVRSFEDSMLLTDTRLKSSGMHRVKIGCLLVLAFAALGHLSDRAANRAVAAEPFQAFLDGLRDRNLYDSALDYLVEMRTSTLISNEIKPILPYEEGRTLIEQARNERDINQKAKQLDLA